MATITLRPTSGTGNNWTNIANVYDGNQSTLGSVSTNRMNYSSRTLVLNFDTSVIPSGATINSATLTIRSKGGKNTITVYVDINQDSANRVINQKQTTSVTNYTANVTSYMSTLTSVEVTAHNTNWSGNTFELYELWIDVDYTAITTYTVTFKDWDGSIIDTQTVSSGGNATPPTPTRTGYDFTGWSGGSYTNVTSDTVLTAQYSIKTFTVRFLDWNNNVLSTQTIDYGSSATPPPNPTRDGYTFSGWSGNYTNVTADVDIIAQYTQNSSGGGSEDTSVKNIKLGASTIDKLYLGTSQILKAYLGSILLYSYSTGGTGGGDTPVIGDNYQLYTGYPLIVENSSLDANYGSYITEIVGNTTQGVSNEVTNQQIVDSLNYYVPNIAKVNDDGTMTTLEATIDQSAITDDTHFIQLKPNTTYIFYCKRIETGVNPSMRVYLGGENLNYEWLQMTTEGVALATNDTGKVLIWIPSAQNGLLNVIVQEGTSLSLESSIRSVGVLQGDGTYKVDIIASNQNGSQTQTKSIYLPQPLRMIEEYSDRLYWDDTLGKCRIEQKIFKTIIDPYDEAIYIDNILTNGKFRVILNLNQSDYFSGWYTSPYPTMCNKIATTTHTTWSGITETSIYFSEDGNCIVVFLESEVSDLDTAKSYLQNLGEIEVYGKYDTARIIETDITDKILFNTYANYTKVITDEKQTAPTSMSGNFASSNLWDGVSYLPGRVDDNPTWGEYDGGYTDNWSLIDPYGIQYDITASSMRGFTLQFENLTSGKYLNFTGKSNQPRYNYPEINFYFFDSSKTYLNKARVGITGENIDKDVILTNGEMFTSVLIPDNATCCEMSFKLSIYDSIVPYPQHIEITNINVIEEDSSLY